MLTIVLCKIYNSRMKWNETSLESRLVDAYFSTQLFIFFFNIWDAIINLFKYNTQVNGINNVVHMKCINPHMFTMLAYTLCNMIVAWSQNTSFPNWHFFATTLAIIKWFHIHLFMATSMFKGLLSSSSSSLGVLSLGDWEGMIKFIKDYMSTIIIFFTNIMPNEQPFNHSMIHKKKVEAEM